MDNSVLQELLTTKDPTEKAAVIAEYFFSALPEKTIHAARQCTLFHWFDSSIIEALLQETSLSEDEKREACKQLVSLPFIETLAWGYRYQSLTREGLLKRYVLTQPELLQVAAHLAAPAYKAREDDKKAAVEALFCYIVAGNQQSSIHLLDKLQEEACSHQDWYYISNLLQLQDEAEQLPFVQPLPRTEEHWLLRGLVHRAQGKLEIAIADCGSAILINSKSALAYVSRGTLYTEQQHYEQALADYNLALRFDSTMAQAYINRGIIYTKQKRFSEALQDFDSALQFDPNSDEAYQRKEQVLHDISLQNKGMHYYLEVPATLYGPPERIALRSGKVPIGRALDNGLVLDDPNIDNHHAEVSTIGQDYWITDLGSVDGTFINGQRITPKISYVLHQDDMIRIGTTFLKYIVSDTMPMQEQKHRVHQQPGLEHGLHQQPGLEHGLHQQPGLEHGLHQQPGLEHGLHQQPGLEHGLHQQPGLEHGLHLSNSLQQMENPYSSQSISYRATSPLLPSLPELSSPLTIPNRRHFITQTPRKDEQRHTIALRMMKLTPFLYHLQGYRLLIGLAIVLTFAQVGADLLSGYPLKFILDKVTAQGHPNPSFPDADVLRHLFIGTDPQTNGVIGLSVLLFIVLRLLDAFLSFMLLYLAAFIAKNLTSRLSRQLFNHLLRLSIQWHNNHEQGDLAQRITGNLADLEKFVADGLVDMLASILTVIGIVVLMAVTNPLLTLVAIMIIPILGLIVYTYTSKIKAAEKKEKKAEGQVSSITTETMGKIMEIKAFTLESFMSKLFLKNSDKRLDEGRKAGNLQAQFTPLIDIVLAIATAVIIAIGAISATTNQPFKLGPLPAEVITLGTLSLFLGFLTKLYQPIRNLSKLTTLATRASIVSERIQEVLDEKTEVLAIASDYKGPMRFEGTITYEDVYFSYPSLNPGPIILKGINLHIPTGQKVALVGLSGSGKTTLTNLLLRFYEIPQWWGKVKIDGVDINEYPLSVLRSNISIIMQDSILFNGTIRENIKIGHPEATDEEMFKAAEQACIHETIIKRPEGYNAKIINEGKNLPGGQRQRIAIARAILRNTPIIIMDDPTAALDVEAEAEVMRALDSLAEGRTVIVITHRLSTLGIVDQIVVLKDGRIAEQGNYKELKKKGGIFANLLKVQNAFDLDDEMSQSFILTASQPPDRSTSEAELLMELDGQIISKRQLDKALLTIGRMVQNDIQVPLHSPAAQHVSRLHAKIVWKNNRWVIQDADSKYGLHYNGQKIDERVLKDGDRIYIAPAIALVYAQKGQRPISPILISQKVPAIQSSPQHIQHQKAQVLIEVDGQLIGKRELDKATLTIACKQENPNSDIQIPAQFMGQGINAQIVWENGHWVVKAKHRVRYNGQIVPQHTFANGDRVYLAPLVILTYQSLP